MFRAPPAAPAGGACRSRWGRGCGLALALGVAVTAAPLGAQEAVTVPSGQPVRLHEVLMDDAPGALWVRFRFVAPRIGAAGDSVADMDHLCAQVALPYLAEHRIDAVRVVISLSDRELPFGEPAPDATQYFEVYRPENGRCIWEGF